MSKIVKVSSPLLALLGIICLIMASTSFAYICGDVNADGNVNLIDILYLIDYKYGTPPGPEPDPLVAGDVNHDDSINLIDILYLIDYKYGTPSGPEPQCSETVTDIDGNVYQTVTIGTQVWMKENLKVTHYRNGDAIPNVTDNDDWYNLTTGAYRNYNNDINNVAVYGRLYNWYAVDDSRNIAPVGWHVPTDDEWKQLEMFLGMSQAQADAYDWRGTNEGAKLKESGTTHWVSPNNGTNESEFTALPGGFCTNGSGMNMGITGSFWTSTEHLKSGSARFRELNSSSSRVSRWGTGKYSGFSVRCVKD